MKAELIFNKYKLRGPDYHYRQIDRWNFFEYNAFVVARYKKQIDLILKFLNGLAFFSDRPRILDIGCGDGVLLDSLTKKATNINLDIYGIDSSAEAIEIARKKNNQGSFSLGNVYELPFAADYFDMVISSDVIEHVNNAAKMLAEAKRVLKKNGLIVLGTPIRLAEKPNDIMHVHEFFQEELKSICNTYFTMIEFRESHDLLFYLLYNRNFKIIWRKFSFFRYIFNLLAILGYNLFSREGDKQHLFSYMFYVGKK